MAITVNRPGQVNSTGDVRAQFRDLAQAEVMTKFEVENLMAGRTRTITITEGQSASFPATGDAVAEYHTVGAELQGANFNSAEIKVVVDDELLTNFYLSKIDEKMLHYDVRSPITEAMGKALAKRFDQNILQVGVLAARSNNAVSGLAGGSVITAAGVKTDPKKLAAAIYAAREALDNKGVPATDCYAYVTPKLYYGLVQNLDAINKDWGGMGSYADGKIVKIAGIELVMVPGDAFPTKDLSTDAAITAAAIRGVTPSNLLAKYRGDFSKTAALIMHRDAVGTVKLFDLAFDVDWIADKRVNLLVASYVLGHGVLRPECAVEIAEA